MRPLSDFLDYRDYLKEFYEWRKSQHPYYSYRVLASRLEMNVSQVYRILQKDLHLPLGSLMKVNEVLELDTKSAEHFELLVKYGRARSEKERIVLAEQILSFREIGSRKLQEAEFRVFGDWYAPVIRAMALQPGFDGSASRLAKRLNPPVSEEQVAACLETLLELGLLRRSEDGAWLPAEPHITTGKEFRSHAVREFTKQVLSLAAESIERVPRDKRNISTLTVSLDGNALKDVSEMILECRRQIQRRIDDCAKVDRVVQIAFAIYPVTTIEVGP